ncbi:Polar amino acid transport system permease protein OS=Castellaniella defragrans OX=75697 GN=HNR28_000822 PE=3 SV=1 [Castellaniella defragrans]
MEVIAEFARATLITVVITLGAACLAWIIALGCGIAKTSRRRTIAFLANCFAEFARGTSIYVLMFWLYFVLPYFGIRLNAIFVGILAIGLSEGAYGSEVVRGAIEAVPKGLVEAAVALNFSRFEIARHVILPNALVRMLAPMCNVMVDLLKVTPLVSLITVADLTFAGQLYRQVTGNPILAFSILLVIYFGLSSLIIQLFRMLENRLVKGFSGTRST